MGVGLDPMGLDPVTGLEPMELVPRLMDCVDVVLELVGCWLSVESWVEVVRMGKMRLGWMRIGSRFPHGSVRWVPHFCFDCCCWNICVIRTGVFRY